MALAIGDSSTMFGRSRAQSIVQLLQHRLRAARRFCVSVTPVFGSVAALMRIVQQADEPDANHSTLSVRFEAPRTSVCDCAPSIPTSTMPRLASIQLVIDARSICDDVARETGEHFHRHASVMLRGIAEQHVVALRDDDPEVSTTALLRCLHEYACRVDGDPSSARARASTSPR